MLLTQLKIQQREYMKKNGNNLYLNSDNLNSINYDGFERACKTLEFDKVLDILSTYSSTDGAKERIAALRPGV